MDSTGNPGPETKQDKPKKAYPSAFKPGHQKFGGRRKGAPVKRTAEAREIAEKLGFHPVEFLAKVVLTGSIPNQDGTSTPVTSADRLDAAKAIAPYLLPKLSAQQVSGPDNGPIEHLDVAKLLANSETAEAVQNLALKLSEQAAEQVTDKDGD